MWVNRGVRRSQRSVRGIDLRARHHGRNSIAHHPPARGQSPHRILQGCRAPLIGDHGEVAPARAVSRDANSSYVSASTAPSDRTSSFLPLLPTRPTAKAPARAAIWTIAVPTPPAAPGMRIRPLSDARHLHEGDPRSGEGNRNCRCLLVRQPARRGPHVERREHDLVGIPAERTHRENPLAPPKGIDARGRPRR